MRVVIGVSASTVVIAIAVESVAAMGRVAVADGSCRKCRGGSG